jgi:hypothetical protein
MAQEVIKFLSLANLTKPSNKSMKLLSEIVLFTFPLYSGAVALLASGMPKFALWFNFALSIIMITINAITKFTADTTAEDIPK